MKKLSAILLLLCLSLSLQPVFAQGGGGDAKSKAILGKLSDKMKSLKSLKANFNFVVSNNGRGTSRNGTFYMKGDKYKVVMDKQEIMCDGRTVWTYLKDANEVQVSDYNASEQTISPSKLFTDFYDKEYSYTYGGTSKVAGKAVDVIEMTPIAKNKQFNKVELYVAKDNTLAGGKIFEKNGAQYLYEITSFSPNSAVAEHLFTFDKKKHPKVEVVDLR